ncbi:MAG: hypothetical protein NTW07_13785 [candidate division Zixibacteria bacterium]|nr:hypothetical protein [candidate division Zixibacteria bacterium]
MVAPDRQAIIDAIEQANCVIPQIPGYCDYATISGVLTCVSRADDPMSNKAMLARLDERTVEVAIERVIAHFAARRKPFSWIVGPGSTPADLGSRLLTFGFGQPLVCHGMYLPDPAINMAVNPSIKVREVPVAQPGPCVEIMASVFNMAIESSRSLHEIMAITAPQLRPRIYAAYVDSMDTPVACAYLTHFPDRPIALLCGGATPQEYRGRGVYKALLARRLADITREGINTVIVLADQRTSAPICARAVFAKVCDLQMYVWRPEKSASVQSEITQQPA